MSESHFLEANPLVIVDVGASGGIDPRWSSVSKHHRGVMFEPDPREFHILKSKAANNMTVIQSALAEQEKEVDFHLCRKQEVSSVYRPNIDFLKFFPDSRRFEVTETLKIKTDTLDRQTKENGITDVDFIKIDTQGYELEILKGSKESLENCIGLEIEVEFAHMYEGQPLFNEIDTFVRSKSFVLFDLKRYFWKRVHTEKTGNQKGQLIFGDALYFKTPESIAVMPQAKKKIPRAICSYLAYGYIDLAQSLLKITLDQKILPTSETRDLANFIASYEKHGRLPDFRGKGRIKGFFDWFGKHFSANGWCSGTDRYLGNLEK